MAFEGLLEQTKCPWSGQTEKRIIFEVKKKTKINFFYILNAHILAKKNKEPFFSLYKLICFVLKPAPYISIDLHINYEQRRQ